MIYDIDTKNLPVYLLLNGSILMFYILALIKSVIFIKDQTSDVRTALETCFTVPDLANTKKELEKVRITKKKENLLKMYHAVKCSIIIKRKLKKIRSKLEERNAKKCNQNDNDDILSDFVFIPDQDYSEYIEESVER